jgi:hypothetical protein
MFLSQIRRHEGWLTFIVVLAVLLVGFASCQAIFSNREATTTVSVPVAQAGNTTLAVYPDRGPAGSYLSVTGAGWPGSETVTIRVADAQGRSDILVESTTSTDGNLAVGFLYPFDQRWLTPGAHQVIAEGAASGLQVTTPFLVSANTLATTTTATATHTVVSPTATVTATLPATPTVLATATALPTETPTAIATVAPTPIPATATETPVPTATPASVANQPPQIQAALVPLDVDDDRKAGLLQVQVVATDPEGSLQSTITILKLSDGVGDWTPKLKEDRKTEIKVTSKRLEIRAPDPQALLDQIVTYGGLVVENGQQIDLRVRNGNEEQYELHEGVWRVEARTVHLEVVAIDSAGLSSTTQVSSCLKEECSTPADSSDED